MLSAVLATAAVGCERKPSTPAPEVAPDVGTLPDQAHQLVKLIRELEHQKDVTCWTSFRQLDQFIATRSYSEFATLAKIAAQKSLVRAVWRKATGAAGSGPVSANHVKDAIQLRDIALSDDERVKLAAHATELGYKDFEDYRKTGEHYRVVLAVTTDAIAAQAKDVAPLDGSGLEALAGVAMQLSLELLKQSGKIATDQRSPFIEGSHIKSAHAELAAAYDIAPSGPPVAADRPAIEPLFGVTKALVMAKVDALEHFNAEDPRSPTKVSNALEAINVVSPMKVTESGLKQLIMGLRSFVRFAAGGLQPMRSDNYLSDGQYAPAKIPRRLYVDVVWMNNVIEQVFPHHVMPNGDIKLRLEPNPGTITDRPRAPRDILLLDHQQNAVRDSAIHWQILRDEFEQRPFVLDPFAAEILSEVVSMMLTHYLWEGQRIAQERGKSEIDSEVAAAVRDPIYVMVPPEHDEARPWSEADAQAKQKALASFEKVAFADVTPDSGLPIKINVGMVPDNVVKADIQRVMGSGIGVGDPDGDGRPDVFIAGEGLSRLFINQGRMKFRDATQAWGIAPDMFDSRSPLFVDYDADGDDDLLIVRSARPSVLYQNEGGRFVDVTEDSGLSTTAGAHTSLAFDADGDGDLDLYIGYYGSAAVNQGTVQSRNLPSIDGRNGSPNQLWLQDDGKFIESGATAGADDVGWTLAAAAFDFDGDGDQDIYVANDFGRNALLQNDGKGRFTDVAASTHTADRGSGMNVSITDVQGDGAPDWYVTNIDMFSKNIKVIFPTSETTTIPVDDDLQRAFQYIAGNKLYVGGKDAIASEELKRFEPGDRGWGWDANFFDADLDGDEDMYLANGWIPGSYADGQRNQLFAHDAGRYFLADPEGPQGFEGNSRAVATADFDGDGDEDILVSNFHRHAVLLENQQDSGNGFVKLRFGSANRAGAKVKLTAGASTQYRWLTIGRGYLSQEAPEVVFGIGGETSWSAVVEWADGRVTSLNGTKNQTMSVAP